MYWLGLDPKSSHSPLPLGLIDPCHLTSVPVKWYLNTSNGLSRGTSMTDRQTDIYYTEKCLEKVGIALTARAILCSLIIMIQMLNSSRHCVIR